MHADWGENLGRRRSCWRTSSRLAVGLSVKAGTDAEDLALILQRLKVRLRQSRPHTQRMSRAELARARRSGFHPWRQTGIGQTSSTNAGRPRVRASMPILPPRTVTRTRI